MEGPHGVGLTTMRLGGVGVREPGDPNQVHLEAEKAKVDTSGQWWRKDNLQMSYLGLLWPRLAPLARSGFPAGDPAWIFLSARPSGDADPIHRDGGSREGLG